MSGLIGAYSIAIGLGVVVLALLWFVILFWQGSLYGTYGEESYTTTLDSFSLNHSDVPDEWLLEFSADNYVSLRQKAPDGCIVDFNKISGIETVPAEAKYMVTANIEQSLQSMDEYGYDVARLDPGRLMVQKSDGDTETWPTVEFEGRWLDGSLYFRQSNALMVGNGYYLQIGRSCQDGDLTPTEAAVQAVRFN